MQCKPFFGRGKILTYQYQSAMQKAFACTTLEVPKKWFQMTIHCFGLTNVPKNRKKGKINEACHLSLNPEVATFFIPWGNTHTLKFGHRVLWFMELKFVKKCKKIAQNHAPKRFTFPSRLIIGMLNLSTSIQLWNVSFHSLVSRI